MSLMRPPQRSHSPLVMVGVRGGVGLNRFNVQPVKSPLRFHDPHHAVEGVRIRRLWVGAFQAVARCGSQPQPRDGPHELPEQCVQPIRDQGAVLVALNAPFALELGDGVAIITVSLGRTDVGVLGDLGKRMTREAHHQRLGPSPTEFSVGRSVSGSSGSGRHSLLSLCVFIT